MDLITVRGIFISLLVAGCLTAVWMSNGATEKNVSIAEADVVRLIVVDGKNYYFPTGSACGNGYINCYESIDGVQVCRSGGTYTKHARRSLEAARNKA